MSHAAKTSAPSRRPRRSLRRALLGVLTAVVVLAVAATGFALWTVQRSFPQTEGRINVAGLGAQVEVKRDALGIATITADTSDDLFFAQGFVHAQDRFWEMDFRRHLTSGRLAELFGESQIGTDQFLRTLGWHRIAEQEVAELPAETRGYYEAYAAGVNAYLAERQGGALSLEYSVLALQNSGYVPEPWTPADSVAWFKAMAWDLRTNIEDETARALQAQTLTRDQLDELYPGYPFEEHPVILADDPAGEDISLQGTQRSAASSASTEPATAGNGQPAALSEATRTIQGLEQTVAEVDRLIRAQGEGIGSNSWVVSGEHTESGKPLLANDPHLGAALPSVWTQLGLRCRVVSEACPFDVAGFSFSGLPGIVIGHNDQVAWGFTNLTTDVADLYVERLADDGYQYDGKVLPFTTRTESFAVAGGDTVEMEVRETIHGPIVSGLTDDFTSIAEQPEYETDPIGPSVADNGPFAVSLKWTALEVTHTAEAIFMMNTAHNYDDFRAAAAQFDVPAQNLIYADLAGNIGYQAPGRLPIRGAGDGWMPQPGWLSDYDWQGYIPFDEQPRSYNPESGYIVTANNAIIDDDYHYFLSRDWDYGYRANRIVDLLDELIAEGSVTSADMTEIQLDNEFPAAQALQQAYAEAFDPSTSSADPIVATALTMLSEWDGQNDADSAAAAFANVLWEHVTRAMVDAVGGTTDDGESVIPRDDQGRFARFFELQLMNPDSVWFGDNRTDLLLQAAQDAAAELTALQGTKPNTWNWGELHALELRSGTFGESGIAPIEAIFNRGPYPVGGGSSVVNATGWTLGEGYGTVTVPSMRMVIDLNDWDASSWQNLTGQSGHAFNRHYVDQTPGWASGETSPWPYSKTAIRASAVDTLILRPV